MVLGAWRKLHQLQRRDAHLAELPIAALHCLTANMNRDTQKRSQPFELKDFTLFHDTEERDDRDAIRPEVAATAMDLQSEGLLPAVVLTAWEAVLKAANDSARPQKPRALHSDDRSVWVVAPRWEGANIRGGLVAVHGRISGPTRLRDIDHGLASWVVRLPDRPHMAWVEADLLLPAAET